MMSDYTIPIADIDADGIALVGGKGANLGALAAAGFAVPPGFCVTTSAYDQFAAPLDGEIAALLSAVTGDLEQLAATGAQVRAMLADLPVPEAVDAAVAVAWQRLGADHPVAVRSSATAEDLPTASFAGQQDTFLNVVGYDELLDKIKACWISLFTDRAILYRIQQGIDHSAVSLSVVVQQMVASEVSGILFTADPVSGRRDRLSIDSGFGLGEALVSGIVTADLFQVDKRTMEIVERKVGPKPFAIESLPGGGTHQVPLDAEHQRRASLNDRWVRELAQVGVDIEAHFGSPQDIEWAIADDELFVVQSRPITTLFPLPALPDSDGSLHAYLSVSHFQVMTDPMPPLAISVLRTIMPMDHPDGSIESRTITHAGGRIYLDVTPGLRHRLLRRVLPQALTVADERFSVALEELASREGVWRGRPLRLRRIAGVVLPILLRGLRTLISGRTDHVATEAFETIEREVAAVRSRLSAPRDMRGRMAALKRELDRAFDPVLTWAPATVAGVLASRMVGKVVGESDDLHASQRGLTGNVATDMNLAVGDLADTARQNAELIAVLQRSDLDGSERIEAAASVPGSERFLGDWMRFLDRYGARGPSEIDLSKPRWHEDPTSLVQMVVNNLAHNEPGSHRQHFEELRVEGVAAVDRLTRRGSGLGWIRRRVASRLLQVSRDLSPLREHHKYYVIRLLADMKRVLVDAGEDLAASGRLDTADDVWFLTMPELFAHYEPRGNRDGDLRSKVAERREAFAHFGDLIPPRVMTSTGEIPAARLDVDAPPNALVGTAVSAGTIEGPAKVITDPSTQHLVAGEILVAPFTDPGWTPLFVNAAGLVTEVGGLMTHGSVVAREYGIPAVVGVEDATTEIETGQIIRINGDVGYVEVLDHETG